MGSEILLESCWKSCSLLCFYLIRNIEIDTRVLQTPPALNLELRYISNAFYLSELNLEDNKNTLQCFWLVLWKLEKNIHKQQFKNHLLNLFLQNTYYSISVLIVIFKIQLLRSKLHHFLSDFKLEVWNIFQSGRTRVWSQVSLVTAEKNCVN